MTRVTSRRGTLLGLVLGWLAVVLVVGGLTFAVVSRAGSQVGQASAMRTVADAPVATSSGSRPAPSASRTPDPPSSATPSASPTPTRSTGSSPSAPSTPPPAPSTRTRSFTTAGGTVVAACTGTRIGVESITVRDGWRFEDERESRKLEIHFSRSGSGGGEVETAGLAEHVSADDDGEVELKIECVGGVPTRTDDD